MRKFLVVALMFIPTLAIAEQAPEFENELEPPELPMPVQSGETMEPDITIIRKGNKTIQEFRKNGKLYMVKITPIAGPPYYLIDTDGDGNMNVRGSDIDKGMNINQWKIFEWD